MELAGESRNAPSRPISSPSPASATTWCAARRALPKSRRPCCRNCKGAVFVAHNARFDYSFLRSEFRKAQLHFSAQVLCTVKLVAAPVSRIRAAQSGCGDGASRAHLRARGIAPSATRRCCMISGSSCAVTWRKTRLGRRRPGLLSAHRLPAHLPPGLADDLPEGPGSIDFSTKTAIRCCTSARANHFATVYCAILPPHDAGPKGRRMTDQVRRVDWVETAGELGAMLREAACIRAQKPMYNQRTKSMSGRLHTAPGPARACERDAGPRSRPFSMGGSIPPILRVFRGVSFREGCAQGARRHRARTAIVPQGFGHRGERGLMPCLSGRTVQRRLHRARSRSSCTICGCSWRLSSLKLKAWPFPGRIALA